MSVELTVEITKRFERDLETFRDSVLDESDDQIGIDGLVQLVLDAFASAWHGGFQSGCEISRLLREERQQTRPEDR